MKFGYTGPFTATARGLIPAATVHGHGRRRSRPTTSRPVGRHQGVTASTSSSRPARPTPGSRCSTSSRTATTTSTCTSTAAHDAGRHQRRRHGGRRGQPRQPDGRPRTRSSSTASPPTGATANFTLFSWVLGIGRRRQHDGDRAGDGDDRRDRRDQPDVQRPRPPARSTSARSPTAASPACRTRRSSGSTPRSLVAERPGSAGPPSNRYEPRPRRGRGSSFRDVRRGGSARGEDPRERRAIEDVPSAALGRGHRGGPVAGPADRSASAVRYAASVSGSGPTASSRPEDLAQTRRYWRTTCEREPAWP